jgi:predicted GNAT family N-acyltransferase
MTTVISGGFGPTDGESSGTEFISLLPPPGNALDAYDNTKPYDQQGPTIPQIFRDAMSVREVVFGEQGVPLEAEFDEDDARSWHWVVYASVSAPSSVYNPPTDPYARRKSSTAQRLPVGTIRLVPPPHGPNKYIKRDKHPDAEPPDDIQKSRKHPKEPYIKFGRLAVLSDYRSMGLSKLLVNTALDYAAKHPDAIRPPPSPTRLEFANQLGKAMDVCPIWQGLAMVHAQVSVASLWAKHGFVEELRDANGEVEIGKEEHWIEEGIEHLAMWRRLKISESRL